MAKRANNEGTLVQLPSGSWRAQISIGGHRIGFTSKKKMECREWLKEKIGQLNLGWSDGSHQTLHTFMESWLVIKQTSLRPSTHYQYTLTCQRYIYPTLGPLKLAEVRPELIQNLYTDILKDGAGPRTVEVVHSVLHNAMAQAVKLGILARNPTDATTPPRVETKEMKFYDETQVGELQLAAMNSRNAAIYHLAIATGMRMSELLGLKWSDLDWQKKTLYVQRQLKRAFQNGDYFAPPKTKNGRRAITLGDTTIAKMREHWQRQNIERAVAGRRWQENDLIFPSSIGTPKNQSGLYREFEDFLKKVGLPKIRFHDLRHTAASLLLNHGIAPIIVSRRLGHYKVSMTLDIYGHLMPEMQGEAAELIDTLITPVPAELPPIAQKHA
jgi:integrase